MSAVRCSFLALLGFVAVHVATDASAATLYVGAASCDITPDQPVFLSGQFNARVSQGVSCPVTANIVALESRDGDKALEQAIVISMDTVVIYDPFFKVFKEVMCKALPEVGFSKVIIAATHTHSAPCQNDGQYASDDPHVMQPSKYNAFAAARISAAAAAAWKSRRPAKFSYGLGHAVVAYNRRAVYADGTAVMYGKTNDRNFRAIEGVEDHDVNSMFFWDTNDKLLAMLVNVSCPSQEVENSNTIDADYWGEVRKSLHQAHGEDVVVVGLCGAAGDLSPHLRYRQAADDRMRELRKLSRNQEIARRIVQGVEEVYEVVKDAKSADVVVKHQAKVVELPERLVTEAEYKSCKAEAEKLLKRAKETGDSGARGRGNWNARIAARYEKLAENPHPLFSTPVNVLRIGDAVICTNAFELYTDFGIQMKAQQGKLDAGCPIGERRWNVSSVGASREGRRLRRRHPEQHGRARRRPGARRRDAEDGQRYVVIHPSSATGARSRTNNSNLSGGNHVPTCTVNADDDFIAGRVGRGPNARQEAILRRRGYQQYHALAGGRAGGQLRHSTAGQARPR